MHGKRTRSFAPAMLAVVIVMASMGTARAQSESRSVDSGSGLYATYCASCHGPSAHGDGSVARFLRVPPADLTQIAKRNKGVFDADRVYQIIDGRQAVKAHGRVDKSEMPVWGDAFLKSETTSGDEKMVTEKIRALVQHLQSIQEKPVK